MIEKPSRLDAEAVVAALERQFADRRAQGSWYRLNAADVRSALANPATLSAPATAAAARGRRRRSVKGVKNSDAG